MINKVLILVFMLALGCSSLSKNMVKSGDFTVSGGRSKTLEWEQNLEFVRFSWFQELTLLFDVMFVEVGKDDPFQNWFSDFEKEEISKCDEFLGVLSYSLDPDKISHKLFQAEMKDNGFSKMEIPTFRSSMRTHPDYEGLSLKNYHVGGFCRKTAREETVISFPGFLSQKIEF